MEVYFIGQQVGPKCTARTFKVKILGSIVTFNFLPCLTCDHITTWSDTVQYFFRSWNSIDD